ncbi:putative secreted protein with PEP-CTERM sorting signal [Janthinobacterium sp. 61]|nr:putative secreted protein with PEP-CTERM sorting signal [Janthinobacterium sp. 61]
MRKLRKKKSMKLPPSTLALLVTLACTAAQVHAEGVPLFGQSLSGTSVFALTYATTGANSTVTGDIVSGDVATMGAASLLSGNLQSLGAATIGANAVVSGNMVSGGAATVGANATVAGKVAALGAITLSASSTTHGADTLSALPTNVQSNAQQIGAAQAALKNMGQGTALGTTMTLDTTLYPGVFTAANLSTTAGITLTLDGQNRPNQSWVFNIDDYLVTGAAMKIVLINADASNSVIWNSGGYTSLGASGEFIGTILAKDYVSVGAGTSVTGVGSACGGLYSATSYVSTGDGARIGGSGCRGIGSGFDIVDGTAVRSIDISPVPEPSTYAMLVAGLALLGLMRQRKQARV